MGARAVVVGGLMFEYAATLRNVHDGDTLTVRVDYGFRQGGEWELRAYGIQAPELNTDAGKAARQWLVDRLPVSERALVIRTFKPKPETFGRFLALLYVDGADIWAEEVAAGHAVVWFP